MNDFLHVRLVISYYKHYALNKYLYLHLVWVFLVKVVRKFLELKLKLISKTKMLSDNLNEHSTNNLQNGLRKI